MCRNCALPEWGEPIKIPVKELPAFFSKQISWNFERLNYGGGAVMETVSGRPERPSVTGRLGCRLREGMQPPSRGKRTERYLLVSECLYCPGKRYGCTPRTNCTGKRRNCYAMCKVTVYADTPDIAEVSFSGSHGTGNVTDPSLHRPSHEGKKRRLVEEDNSDLCQRWKQTDRPTMVESLGSDTLSLDHSSTEVVALDVAHNVMLTSNNVEVVSQNLSSSSPHIALWTTSADHGVAFQTSWANSNGSTMGSSPTTPSTPLNTPLSSVGVTPQCNTSTPLRSSQGRQPVSRNPPTRTPSVVKSSMGQASPWSSHWKAESPKYSVSRLHGSQHQEKDQEILTLKQHIQILQQEHLAKISRIAELEAQLQYLKDGELFRLEHQVQRLETENLRKDVKILQLEKQLQQFQASLFSRAQSTASPVTVLVRQPAHCEQISSHPTLKKTSDIQVPQLESRHKDDNDTEDINELNEKEIDKDVDNGEDDLPCGEEV
ncbi:PREDICTED: uncharacterized protein LOC107344570 [Acropora digitifera]|uniref:uncharacterized protein LOC107344570 n=1 Tax=Acropora digitifera TaxID=70779 RepID=UPI00077AD4EC|nr:PREDICTED: uncharacterized protein LOC107344570 [Acropora digitifera]